MKPAENPKKRRARDPEVLRRQAEAALGKGTGAEPEPLEALLPEEIRQKLHELRVHQIELEMQNEELRAAQIELEMQNEELQAAKAALDIERARYFDLYDLAPVGYLTVSERGLILQANLTAATLLGVARKALVQQPISNIMVPEDLQTYYRHRTALVETGAPQTCELRLRRGPQHFFWAGVTATVAQAPPGQTLARIVLHDITERREAEVRSRLVRDLSLELVGASELGEALRRALRTAIQVASMDAGGIYLLDSPSGALQLACHSGLSPTFVAAVARLEPESPKARSAREGKLFYGSVDALDLTPGAKERQEGLRALAFLPVHYEGRLLALLSVASHALEWFPAAGRTALETVANLIGTTVERLQTQEAVRASHRLLARYQLLSDNANDIFLFVRPEDGRIIEANTAACNTYGYGRADLLAKTIYDLRAGDAATRAAPPLPLAREDGLRFEALHVNAEGHPFPVEVSSRAAQVEGEIILLSVVRDLRGRVRLEEELRQLNGQLERRVQERTAEAVDLYQKTRELSDRLALAARAGGMGIGDLNLGTGRLIWDEQMLRLYGLTHDQFSGRSEAWSARLHLDDRARAEAEIQSALRGEKDFNTEFRVFWPDGSVHRIRAMSLVRRDASGQPLGIVGINWDITAQKQAEAQLRLLQSAVEQSPTVVMIANTAAVIEYVNPAFETQTGYSAGEAVGQNPRILQSGRHEREFYQQMWRQLTAGQPWRGELCNKRKDGALYWELTTIAPMRDEQGRLTHYVAIKEDITERRRVGAELLQAKDAAEAANQAKRQFLANMSHELRTPMNAILGFSQLLLREAGVLGPQRRQLAAIHHGGEHLLEIINDILEMARIESGRLTLNPAPFDLPLLVEHLVQMFSQRASRKNLQFHVEWEGTGPRHVVADPTKLRQVLINLLGNAVKFTPSGGQITLRVGLNTEPEGTLCLRLEVEDTGTGVPAADLPRLFEPFFQADSGKQTAGGTGLGLAISRQFARLMGGDLQVTSRVGQGSTFLLSLPVGRVEGGVALPSDLSVARNWQLFPGVICRVLVADDEPDNRELLEQLLTSAGFEVRLVADGAEAVAQCQEWAPQVVLMDLKMPNLDGCEAARRIRAAQGPGVKIIALSAGVLAEHQQQAQQAGMDAFLGKPFRETGLFEEIQRLTGVAYQNDGDTQSRAGAEPEGQPEWPSAEEIGRLPGTLVAALSEAVDRADYDKILTLVEQVTAQNERLGRRLGQWASRFDYVSLQKALRLEGPGA